MKIDFVSHAYAFEMMQEGSSKFVREDSTSVFESFSMPDEDLHIVEIEVFNAKPEGFHESEAGSIEELGYEERCAGKVRQEAGYFNRREDDGQVAGLFGSDESIGQVEVDVEDMFVEKEDSIAGLILGRACDVAIDGKVGEVRNDMRGAELVGVLFIVEEDKPFGPSDISVFCMVGVIELPAGDANLVEEFGHGASRFRDRQLRQAKRTLKIIFLPIL